MYEPLNSNLKRVEQKSYKHPPSFKKSIDITFIENGPVFFESLDDKQKNIYLYNIYYIFFIVIFFFFNQWQAYKKIFYFRLPKQNPRVNALFKC